MSGSSAAVVETLSSDGAGANVERIGDVLRNRAACALYRYRSISFGPHSPKFWASREDSAQGPSLRPRLRPSLTMAEKFQVQQVRGPYCLAFPINRSSFCALIVQVTPLGPSRAESVKLV